MLREYPKSRNRRPLNTGENYLLLDEPVGNAKYPYVDNDSESLFGLFEWVKFPSGETLVAVKGDTAEGQEHYDPNHSGLPLLDVSGSNASKKLSRNFTVKEFAHSGVHVFTKARIDPKLVECLQKLRDYIGRPIKITSGYRPYGFNIRLYKKRGQKPTQSQHTSGRAVDIHISGMTGMDIAKAAIQACGCDIGVGIASDHAHIDVRGEWAKWTYFRDATQNRLALREIEAFHRKYCSGAGKENVIVKSPQIISRHSPSDGSAYGSLLKLKNRIFQALKNGSWKLAVGMLIQSGNRDPNKLTNMIFHAKHPELHGRSIKRDEHNLASEWRDIKNNIILPILRSIPNKSATDAASNIVFEPAAPNVFRPLLRSITPYDQPRQTPIDSVSDNAGFDLEIGKLGKLLVDTSIPPLRHSKPNYQFTADDALWLAKFVEGEAGGRNDKESHAVIWAMFNRFGIFRHRIRSWKSFAIFLKKYSTTLQPLLNNVGAARRIWKNHKQNPIKYPVVASQDTYKTKDKRTGQIIDTGVKKVQYSRHIKLQKKQWREFKKETRSMVLQMLRGQIPNPGIGIASEFASTNIYYRTKYGITPNEQQWVNYTNSLAKSKNWLWIGYVDGLNQRKNAFFIDKRLQNVPPTAVNIVY